MKMESKDLLKIENLVKHFKTSSGIVHAVDGVSFKINQGETYGLVGESGSGKTTIGNLIMGFYTPTSGKIIFKDKDISKLSVSKRPKELKREIQIVFQDPSSSLNPKSMVKDIIGLPIRVHNTVPKDKIEEKVIEILEFVGLSEEYAFRYPRELGGGEKQLVAIARSLASNPSFIVLDEPTSALDVSMQASVLQTLLKIQKELGISYLLITHDLGVVANITKRVGIMYLGKQYEEGPTKSIFKNPSHPYTQMLFSSIPVVSEEEEKLKPNKIVPVGEIPSAVNPPSGCRFHTRCPFAMEICKKEEPPNIYLDKEHKVNCWLYYKK